MAEEMSIPTNHGWQRGFPAPTTEATLQLVLHNCVLMLAIFTALATSARPVLILDGEFVTGDLVLPIIYPQRYLIYFCCNATAFVASLVVILTVKLSALFSNQRIKYRVLQIALTMDLCGIIGAYAAGSCRSVKASICCLIAFLAAVCFSLGIQALLHSVHRILNKLRRIQQISVSEQGNGNNAYQILRKLRSSMCLACLGCCGVMNTYMSGLHTPGGFWKQNQADIPGLEALDHHDLPGDPLLRTFYPRQYLAFYSCNTTAFFASVTILIVLVSNIFSSREMNYFVLQIAVILNVFGLIGSFTAISCQEECMFAALFLCASIHTLVFMLQTFQAGAIWLSGLRQKMEQCMPGWRNEIFADEYKSEFLHDLLLWVAIAAADKMFETGMHPPSGLWKQLPWPGHRRPYLPSLRSLAFFYFKTTIFFASLTIIMLLMNAKLPARGMRQYALWVCVIVGLICVMGAFLTWRRCWDISRNEVFSFLIGVLLMLDIEEIREICLILDLLGEDALVLQGEGSDGELETALTGGGPNGDPASWEISSSMVGRALTLVVAVPVWDTPYNYMLVFLASVPATIVAAIWRKLFAPPLMRLTTQVENRYMQIDEGTTSLTPQYSQTLQAACQGVRKVTRSLCSGTWVWIVIVWALSANSRLGMKFKISKLTGMLRNSTTTETAVVAVATTDTAATGTAAATPVRITAPSTSGTTGTAVATPALSTAPSTSGTRTDRNNQLVIQGRSIRNRTRNRRIFNDDYLTNN